MHQGRLFGAGLILLGLIMLIIAVAQAISNAMHKKCTAEITATVQHKRKHHTKNGISYEMTVTYNVNDVTYDKTIGVTPEMLEDTNEGGLIVLKYNPKNPKSVALPIDPDPKVVRVVLIIAAVSAVVGVLLLLFS